MDSNNEYTTRAGHGLINSSKYKWEDITIKLSGAPLEGIKEIKYVSSQERCIIEVANEIAKQLDIDYTCTLKNSGIDGKYKIDKIDGCKIHLSPTNIPQ